LRGFCVGTVGLVAPGSVDDQRFELPAVPACGILAEGLEPTGGALTAGPLGVVMPAFEVPAFDVPGGPKAPAAGAP
jgi:hypothetical protein